MASLTAEGTIAGEGIPKHAFAPFAPPVPFLAASWVHVSPGHVTGSAANTRAPASQTSRATDDPVNETDPTGDMTVGICVGANVQLEIFNLKATECLTRTVGDPTGQDDIGVTSTLGAGLGLGEYGGVSLFYQVTNATRLQELRGEFDYGVVSGADIGGATVGVFWGASAAPFIFGMDVGVSLGGGAEGAVGVSYTWVDQFTTTVQANVARGIWDAYNPELALQTVLERASKGVVYLKKHPTPQPSPHPMPPGGSPSGGGAPPPSGGGSSGLSSGCT